MHQKQALASRPKMVSLNSWVEEVTVSSTNLLATHAFVGCIQIIHMHGQIDIKADTGSQIS
jgi:hypothetical protein